MFFDRERTRVELYTEECHVGNVAFPELANWEAYEQRYVLEGCDSAWGKTPGESSHEAQTPLISTEGYLK
jgi:hypothetical protein